MSTLKCPQCGGDLTPDHNNPGKMLCYNCRKRMDEDKVRQYWGQYAQPREQQTGAQAVQASQPIQPTMPAAQAVGHQPQQPAQAPASAPYQPQTAPAYQDLHPQYGGTPTPAPQPEQPQSGGFANANAQQATFAASAFTNPSTYTAPPGFDALPSDHATRPLTFSLKKFNIGQFFASFGNLFTSPQQAKIDAAQNSGIAMGWFSALVKILLYIMAVALVISGVYDILTPVLPSVDSYMYRLYPAMTVMHVLNGIVMIFFAIAALFMRKQLGDFIVGAWKKFVVFLGAYAAWGIIYAIVYDIAMGISLFAFLGVTFILSLALQLVVIGLNWVYFKKREPLFTAVYPDVQPPKQNFPQQQYPPQNPNFPQGQQFPPQQPQQFNGQQPRQPYQQPQQPYNQNTFNRR